MTQTSVNICGSHLMTAEIDHLASFVFEQHNKFEQAKSTQTEELVWSDRIKITGT